MLISTTFKYDTEEVTRQRFLVKSGDSLFPIAANNVAYFYGYGNNVFLISSDNRRFIINESLKSLEERLDPHNFYRVNRNFILNRSAIQKITSLKNGKVLITILPEPNHLEDVIVPQLKVKSFKVWIS